MFTEGDLLRRFTSQTFLPPPGALWTPYLTLPECGLNLDVPKLFAHRLTLQRLHVKVVGLRRHDEEDDHGHVVPVDLCEDGAMKVPTGAGVEVWSTLPAAGSSAWTGTR